LLPLSPTLSSMVELTLLAFFGRIFLGANAMEDGEKQEWDLEMVMTARSKWKRSEYDCY
jgi:hypothetical protein